MTRVGGISVALVVAAAWLASGLFGLAFAGPAECAWCPSNECLSDSTCGRCTCLIVGGETKGRCYSRTD